MTAWTNSDGLKVKFGLDESKKAKEGTIAGANGTDRVIIADILGTDLTASSAALNGGGVPSVILPAGAILRRATFITEVAFDSAGDAGTLNIGLNKVSDDTALDADGIDATIAQSAIDVAGETVTCDGALVATALASDAYLVADYDTAAFTAGRGKLIIELVMPDA